MASLDSTVVWASRVVTYLAMAESNLQVQNRHMRELPWSFVQLLYEAGFPTACQAGMETHQNWENEPKSGEALDP